MEAVANSPRSTKLRAARILRDRAAGYNAEAILRHRGEDEAFVQRVLFYHRTARGLLSRGYRPAVVFANFCDLLTREACGL